MELHLGDGVIARGSDAELIQFIARNQLGHPILKPEHKETPLPRPVWNWSKDYQRDYQVEVERSEQFAMGAPVSPPPSKPASYVGANTVARKEEPLPVLNWDWSKEGADKARQRAHAPAVSPTNVQRSNAGKETALPMPVWKW